MEKLISLVNKLQLSRTALGEESAIPTLSDLLPYIAVVGGQSSGKSSVLESLVGKDFLPKGSGIVTRRPLVLQLHGIDGTGEYAEFLHQPGKRFTDFAEVRKEIADETDRGTGCPKAISSVPIHLSIYSPNVVNLTLIDLPGLAKVAVEGQLDSVVQDIENMVRAFIEKPNCVILAVSPANQDLATCDAIKISQEVDPKGERTFGVLTKIDLVDNVTNAVVILEGRAYRLPFPWIGVVNQYQENINENAGMIASRDTERDYFANTPEYKHLAHRMGSEYLAKNLSKHLESVIKSRIPVNHLFNDCCINSPASKKNMLQGYTLRAYGKFPMYQLYTEGELHNMNFKCIVHVQDQKFISETHHRHRKEAEEDAASVAYKALMGNESMETLLHIINQGSFCLITTLTEFVSKKKLSEPIYASSQVAATSQLNPWVSTVTLDGETYIGDNARTKRLSAQKAAATAIQSMLEDGDDLMIKIVQAKRRRALCPKKERKDPADPVTKKRKLLDTRPAIVLSHLSVT